LSSAMSRVHASPKQAAALHAYHGPSTPRLAMRALLLAMVAGVLLSACLQLWSWTLHAKGIELKDSTSPVAEAYGINLKSKALNTRSVSSSREQYRIQLRRSALQDRAAAGVISAAVAGVRSATAALQAHSAGADGAVNALAGRSGSRVGIGSAPAPQQQGTSDPDTPQPVAPPCNQGTAKHQQQQQQQQQEKEKNEKHNRQQEHAHQEQQQQQRQGIDASILAGAHAHPTDGPTLVQTTHSIAAAGSSTTGSSKASVLQLARAYEESLAGLSMALQMTQHKAAETAALRDLLGQASQRREQQLDGRGSSSTSNSNGVGSSALQGVTQQQHINITALAAREGVAADGALQEGAGTGPVTGRGSTAAPVAAADPAAGLACGRGSGQRIRLFIGVYVSNTAVWH
jgi:hypothetical protein